MDNKYITKINNEGFTIIENCEELNKDETLYVTGCCAKKVSLPRCKVKDLYLSPRVTSFIKNIKNYNSGIISEKYGLVDLDEEIDNYDFGPKDLKANPILIEELQNKLKEQINRKKVKNLVYFGPPLMSIWFMHLLSKVECNKYLCYGTNRLTKDIQVNSTKVKKNKITLSNKKLF